MRYTTFDPNIHKHHLLSPRPLNLSTTDKYNCRYRLNVNDHIGYTLYVKKSFDSVQTDAILVLARLHSSIKLVYLDLGAHIGTSFIPVARDVPSIAVELNISSFVNLSINCSLNNLRPYSLLNAALVFSGLNDLSEVSYSFSPSNTGNCVVQQSNLTSSNNVSYSALTFDSSSIPKSIPALSQAELIIIKIDIEGLEYEILHSLLPNLSSPFIIFFEYRPDLYPTEAFELMNYLASIKLQIFSFEVDQYNNINLSPCNTSSPYKSLIATSNPSLVIG